MNKIGDNKTKTPYPNRQGVLMKIYDNKGLKLKYSVVVAHGYVN